MPGNPVFQRGALEQLHHDERAVGPSADLVNDADRRMVQRRSGACFSAEALKRLRIPRDCLRKELERDHATEVEVLGFIDDTHAPAAQPGENPVVRDGLAEHRADYGGNRGGKGQKAEGRGQRAKGSSRKGDLTGRISAR